MEIRIKDEDSNNNKRITKIEGEDSSYIIIAIDSTGISNQQRSMDELKMEYKRKKRIFEDPCCYCQHKEQENTIHGNNRRRTCTR